MVGSKNAQNSRLNVGVQYSARDHDKLAEDGDELVVRGGDVKGDVKGSEA